LLLAALVDVDERGVSAPAAFDVLVELTVGEVRLSTDKSPEGGRRPMQYLVPLAKPRQLFRRFAAEISWDITRL
jgi:hypothetical protein